MSSKSIKLTPIKTARDLERLVSPGMYSKGYHIAIDETTVWRDDVNPTTVRAAIRACDREAVLAGNCESLSGVVEALRGLRKSWWFDSDMECILQRMVLDYYARGGVVSGVQAERAMHAIYDIVPNAPKLPRGGMFWFDPTPFCPEKAFDRYADLLCAFLVALDETCTRE